MDSILISLTRIHVVQAENKEDDGEDFERDINAPASLPDLQNVAQSTLAGSDRDPDQTDLLRSSSPFGSDRDPDQMHVLSPSPGSDDQMDVLSPDHMDLLRSPSPSGSDLQRSPVLDHHMDSAQGNDVQQGAASGGKRPVQPPSGFGRNAFAKRTRINTPEAQQQPSSLLEITTNDWLNGWQPQHSVQDLEDKWRHAHHQKPNPSQFTNTSGFVFVDSGQPKVVTRAAHGWARRRDGARSFRGVGYYTRKPSMRDYICMRVDPAKDPKSIDYECGHIVADSIGGPPANPVNFFPQTANSNRGAGSPYYAAEAFVRDVSDSHPQCDNRNGEETTYVSLLACMI